MKNSIGYICNLESQVSIESLEEIIKKHKGEWKNFHIVLDYGYYDDVQLALYGELILKPKKLKIQK